LCKDASCIGFTISSFVISKHCLPVKMADLGDDMDIQAGEDAESQYFQTVTTHLNNALEESSDSMQGSLTLPMFEFGQSNELQGSQGFQFVGVSDFRGRGVETNPPNFKQTNEETGTGLSKSNKVALQALLLSRTNQASNFGIHSSSGQVFNESTAQPAFNVSASDTASLYQGNLNTLIFQGSNFSAFGSGIESVRSAPREILPNSVLSDMPVSVKQEVTGQGCHGDSGEGASSDEKSGKTKFSPKRRSRKGRSTSSTGSYVVSYSVLLFFT